MRGTHWRDWCFVWRFITFVDRNPSLMWHSTSSKQPPHWLTSVETCFSPLSFLKFSSVCVCLLVLMILYVTLYLKHTEIIDEVEKLDSIQDGFIHYQFLRFCQDTRLQYLNSHILLGNRWVIQLQHVDCKIADAILKKGTKHHTDGWDTANKVWTHMVLYLPHPDGGFCVQCNDITKDVVFYTTTSRFVVWLGPFSQERQGLWLSKDDLKDSSSWSSTPLLVLRDIHNDLVTRYEYKDSVSLPVQSGTRRTSSDRASQDGVSHQQETTPLFIPQFNHLNNQANLRGEDASDAGPTIPRQHRLTHQILQHSQPSGTANLRLWSRVVLNSYVFACISE